MKEITKKYNEKRNQRSKPSEAQCTSLFKYASIFNDSHFHIVWSEVVYQLFNANDITSNINIYQTKSDDTKNQNLYQNETKHNTHNLNLNTKHQTFHLKKKRLNRIQLKTKTKAYDYYNFMVLFFNGFSNRLYRKKTC